MLFALFIRTLSDLRSFFFLFLFIRFINVLEKYLSRRLCDLKQMQWQTVYRYEIETDAVAAC